MEFHFLDFPDTNHVTVRHVAPSYDHTADLPLSAITYMKRPDGSDDDRYLVVPCPQPGCPGVCYVSANGGGNKFTEQELHLRYRVTRKGEGFRAARDRLQTLTAQMDPNPERFQFKDAATLAEARTRTRDNLGPIRPVEVVEAAAVETK